MIRLSAALAGAATFAAAQAFEAALWTTAFRGVYAPWFLNSGRAVAFMATCLASVAALIAAADRREALARGMSFAGGAVVTMLVALFAIGPGTLFPIAIALGAVIVIAATAAGAWAGSHLRSRFKR